MSKYRAIKTEFNGITFDSKKEAVYYRHLKLLMKAKSRNERVIEIILQPRFDIVVNDCKIGFYKADFQVYYADGTQEIIDVKGYIRTPVYRLKKKLVEAIYGIRIIEV